MALVPHKITALAETDSEGGGSNVVAGAVVSLYDNEGSAVTLFDNESGANGSTAKSTDSSGQVVVWVTPGEYDEAVNGSTLRKIVVGGNNPTEVPTFSELQMYRPHKTGQAFICQERGNAKYILQSAGYSAESGDVTFANGRIGALQIDGVAKVDWFANIQDAINKGIKIEMTTGKTYSYTDLLAVSGVEINMNGATLDCRSLSLSSIDGFTMKGGKVVYSGVDSGYAWLDINASDKNKFIDIEFESLPSSGIATASVVNGSEGNIFEKCSFINCESTAIGIDGSANGVQPSANKVLSCRFEGGDFGVRLKTTNNNEISGNYTVTGTGIELIGLQQGADNNIVSENIAQLTGDNGISISGNYNTVTGNICRSNQKAGIWSWGSYNNICNNICKNNVTGGGQWAGIGVSANFGGTGQFNTISGNTLDDDQASPTQHNCIRFSGSAYLEWAQSQSVNTSSGNVYRFYGLNVYVATSSGTTGATAPTHDSGTVSDGGVNWRYVTSFIAEADSIFNNAIPNAVIRASSNLIFDVTGRNKYNTQSSVYTDGDLRLVSGSSTAFIRAEGTEDDVNIRLDPKGQGRVSFGTHESIGAQTVTGFIRIYDESGVQRFLAVVS